MNQQAPQIKGIPLTLGGVTYTLPPASLALLEEMAEPLDKVNKAFAEGRELALTDIVFIASFATECLRRNHPDIDRAVVAKHIGLENVLEVMHMCLDVSGLMRKRLEAEAQQQAGAAQEGGTLGESAGTASSLTS